MRGTGECGSVEFVLAIWVIAKREERGLMWGAENVIDVKGVAWLNELDYWQGWGKSLLRRI
jgi:hypothetical protein